MNYPEGDMLIRLKNGQQAKLKTVKCSYSKYKSAILEVLKSEGYIVDFEVIENSEIKKDLIIHLRYLDGQAVINDLKLVTKPGRKIYQKIADMPKYRNGLATTILSTSKGVMSDHDARKPENKVGGLVICKIF